MDAKNLNIDEKKKILGINKDTVFTDDEIENLYNQYTKQKLKKEKELEKVKEKIKVDETSPKYKVLLVLINGILKNINKPEITNLTDFIDIDREDIIKDINDKTFEDMENNIFKYFKKSATGWYRRKATKNYVLAFIRTACQEIGLELSYRGKNIAIDDKITSRQFYSIVETI